MDFFGPREVVITIGILVVIAILLDGVRRVRQARNAEVRMAPRRRGNHIFDDSDGYHDDPLDKSQFPSGGPRVVGTRGDDDLAQVEESIRRAARENSRIKYAVPQQEQFELEQSKPAPEPPAPAKSKQPEPNGDVLVLHLMASEGEEINGQKLLDAALASGMRYGAKKIFHRHEQADGSGEVLFSMANAVNPGTFELSSMGDLKTPGITLFMEPGVLQNPLNSFETMVSVVDDMAENLHLNVLDETRSSMTRQTFDHYRQRAQNASVRRPARD